MSALDRITADNPSPMTLEGTNSFILRSRDRRQALLVDPGPELAGHKRALLEAVGEAKLTGIILTHHHADHSEMLGSVGSWAPNVPVHAYREEWCRHVTPLADGQTIEFGDDESDRAQILLTPGHTDDSVSIIHRDTLLSGDTILGHGTTVIMYPEGSIAGYLRSLDAITRTVESGRVSTIEPAHGPVIADPAAKVREYIDHRHERLEQVRGVLESLGEPILTDAVGEIDREQAGRVADVAYAEVPDALRPAVLASVSSQLEYLAEQG